MSKGTGSIWLKVVLAISLGLNLLVAGIVAGALIWDQPNRREAPGIREQGLFSMIALLPRDDRKDFRDKVSKAQKQQPAHSYDPREWKQQLVAILRAETFDAEAFRSHLSERRKRYETFGVNGEAALSELLASKTHEERLKYADRLERWEDRRKKPRDR